MKKTTLTAALLFAGLTLTGVQSAEAQAATPAKSATLPPASTREGVTFDKDIKPLFDTSCVRCHGAQKPKAQLRLDSREGVLKGSEDGAVIVPGDSAKSKLVTAVARISPKSAMPPEPRGPRRGGPGGPGNNPGGNPSEVHPSTGQPSADKSAGEGAAARPGGANGRMQGPPPKPLTAEEVGLVRAWIDQGAK